MIIIKKLGVEEDELSSKTTSLCYNSTDYDATRSPLHTQNKVQLLSGTRANGHLATLITTAAAAQLMA